MFQKLRHSLQYTQQQLQIEFIKLNEGIHAKLGGKRQDITWNTMNTWKNNI
jgi:hypothetical protein